MYTTVREQGVLRSGAGFWPLVCAQSLGAFNDNVYKMVVSLIAVDVAAGGASHLSLAGVVFVLPYILLSGYGGFLADRFAKHRVLAATKLFEVAVMGSALVALATRRVDLLLATLFLLAAQATLFSPAKYGILPEMLEESKLARANGVLELTRYGAIILGTAAGGGMMVLWRDRPMVIGCCLVGTAVVGWLASLAIGPSPRGAAAVPFQANPWGEVVAGLRGLAGDRMLGLAAVGIALLDFVGTLVMLSMILAAGELMGIDEARTGLLAAAAGTGIGLGCFVAGRIAAPGNRFLLVALGGAACGGTLLLLSIAADDFVTAAGLLVALGAAGGMMLVPLNTLLQGSAPAHQRGRLIATVNFLDMAGVLAASALPWLLHDVVGLSIPHILQLCGLVMLSLMVSGAQILRVSHPPRSYSF